MGCDKFYALINEICNLIGFGMNSNSPLFFISLVDTAMFLYCKPLLIVFVFVIFIAPRKEVCIHLGSLAEGSLCFFFSLIEFYSLMFSIVKGRGLYAKECIFSCINIYANKAMRHSILLESTSW